MSDLPKCALCGEPMPSGEDMFKFHGYSGPCPKPPLERPDLVRPTGSNADEWNLFLSETTSEYACVQIADLLDEKADRIATLEAENARLAKAEKAHSRNLTDLCSLWFAVKEGDPKPEILSRIKDLSKRTEAALSSTGGGDGLDIKRRPMDFALQETTDAACHTCGAVAGSPYCGMTTSDIQEGKRCPRLAARKEAE